MNEFLIELQAILNREVSKGNIDKSITRLQEQIKKLQLQAEIDPKTILNLKRQIEKITNQSITFSNININQSQIEKTGQKIGKGLNNGFLSALASIKNSIYNTINDFNSNKLLFSNLSNKFNLNRADIDSSVLKQVHDLTKEIESLSKEVMKTGSDSSWDNITNKINSLYSVLNQFGKTRDLTPFKESLDILKQFEYKKIFVNSESELFQNTGMKLRELKSEFKKLHVTFTTSKKDAIDLDTVWSELCNTSPNLEKFITFGDQINAIVEHLKVAKEALYGNDSLQPVQGNEVSKMLIEYMDRLSETSNKLSLLREQETEIKQNAVSTADTVVQNEEKKQQAYKQTAEAQKQILANESLIKSGANVTVFGNTNNAAREASEHFKKLLQDENTLIAVSEKFNKANELSSFAVNIRRASGEVETLRYALENISTNGDPFYVFKNIGAELNNSQAEKQIQQMQKVITDYETKLNDFKTRYSKTNIDFSGFDTAFNNFKQGIGTVNDLKLAFNQLENSAKTGVQSLKSQSASLDPIQQALNNMRDLPSMLQTLQTNMEGLQNKTGLAGISVDDLTSRYMKLKSEMDSAGGKVPLTDGSWAKEYQKLMADVVSATKRVTAEQVKAEKSTNSLFASFKKNFSFLSYWTSATFLFMKAIQSVKNAISTIKSLDTALVDLKKTTSMTSKELEDFYYTSNKVAKQMGVTTEEIINQAAAWSRLGFSSAEAATKMAQLSSKFASISPGMSTEQAQEGLVSIIKAWGLDVSDVEREIMDNINTLGNKFAESNADIVEGMKRSAAALAATGTTYQDAFALFTGAQEVLQNAEVGGRALRTISMRVHGYSEDSEDGLLEVDEELKNITGDLIDLTKTAEHTQGVSIFKEGSDSEFKSLVQYFGEINEIWDEMSQKQQNDFLDKAFGKNQAQAGSAIIQNYKAVTDAIEAMEDAAGSSEREMSIIMDSLDYKLNRLSETGTSIAQNLFQRDDMKTVVDGLTSVVSVIDTLTSKLGLFGSIGMGAGLFAGFKNIGKPVRVYRSQISC